MGQFLLILLVLIMFGLFIFWMANNMVKEARKNIFNVLNKYGLTLTELMIYDCKYVGGHPERDIISNINRTLFGVKNGKLIFFGSNCGTITVQTFE